MSQSYSEMAMKDVAGVESDKQNPPHAQKSNTWSTKKIVLTVIEVMVLTLISLALIGLFLLPTIFYATTPQSSPDQMSMEQNTSNNTFSGSGSGTTGPIFPIPSSDLVCSDGFFFDKNNSNLCMPTCGEFLALPHLRVIQIICTCVSIVASVAVIILVLTVQRNLLVFPWVIFIYVCITNLVNSGVAMIGIFDTDTLFCGGSRSLLVVLEKETVFCRFSGVVLLYCVVQFCVWGCLYSVFLFWGVWFPFHYRQFKESGKMRYAHIATIIVALIVPIPGPFIQLRDGFINTENPNFVCAGRNADVYFYAYAITTTTALAITNILLVLVFWNILKEFVLKKMLAKKRVGHHVGKAELKIMVILLYFTIFGAMGTGANTYINIVGGFQESLNNYIFCEFFGSRPDFDCRQLLDPDRETVIYVLNTGLLTLFLWPVVILVFTVDPKHSYKLCKTKWDKSFRSSSTTSTSAKTGSSSA